MHPSRIPQRVEVGLRCSNLSRSLANRFSADFLQVALDISSDGQISLPPYPENAPIGINNITIFLASYVTGKNLTITNGTASANNASLGNILFQEPGSTVKHVNWIWPDCLVGNGGVGNGSARGPYNVSELSPPTLHIY